MRYTLHRSWHHQSSACDYADLPSAVWNAMRLMSERVPGMRTYIIDQETSRRIEEQEIRRLAGDLPKPPVFGDDDA